MPRTRMRLGETCLERLRVLASHPHADTPPDELASMRRRVEEATRAVSGPRGLEYTFTTLFAIPRTPEV